MSISRKELATNHMREWSKERLPYNCASVSTISLCPQYPNPPVKSILAASKQADSLNQIEAMVAFEWAKKGKFVRSVMLSEKLPLSSQLKAHIQKGNSTKSIKTTFIGALFLTKHRTPRHVVSVISHHNGSREKWQIIDTSAEKMSDLVRKVPSTTLDRMYVSDSHEPILSLDNDPPGIALSVIDADYPLLKPMMQKVVEQSGLLRNAILDSRDW